jgi:hypothetical protein
LVARALFAEHGAPHKVRVGIEIREALQWASYTRGLSEVQKVSGHFHVSTHLTLIKVKIYGKKLGIRR